VSCGSASGRNHDFLERGLFFGLSVNDIVSCEPEGQDAFFEKEAIAFIISGVYNSIVLLHKGKTLFFS